MLLSFAAISSPALAASHPPRYYLSLGDSLARGQQPNIKNVSSNTDDGYVNDLYATEHGRIHQLRLVQLGCGGESTSSFLSGHGNKYASYNRCRPAGGSQIKAAERFLKAHKGQVAFVTLSIGANDVDNCAPNGNIDLNCVTEGFKTIDKNLPKIAARIRAAAGSRTPLVGTTLYDPFLALWFDPKKRDIAKLSASLAKNLNDNHIRKGFAAGKFKVAATDTAFQTYDDKTTVKYDGQDVPTNVARICQYTWMCNGVKPNIHLNHVGYAVMAREHARLLTHAR
jgi:lysophospholipase L1-like esterase